MDGHIKVNSDVLLSKAEEVSGLINTVSKAFDEMKDIISNTNNYWIGEAGNAHRRKYTEKQEKINEGIRRLKENVTDLRTMSGVYTQAEAEAMSEASKLISSVIG